MEDSFQYNLTSQNQTVSPIVINETCTEMYAIYNFTLVDEINQNLLSGASNVTNINVDLDLYSSNRNTLLAEYSHEFASTNPVAICMDNNLSGGGAYSLDVQIQYSAENYSKELYHIEKYVLNKNTMNQNVTLYDLTTKDTQNFKLIVRDSSYLPINGALVQIDRKYIEKWFFLYYRNSKDRWKRNNKCFPSNRRCDL